MPRRQKKQARPVFRTILIPLLALFLAEAALLSGVIVGSRVIDRLNQNAEEIVQQQVSGRASYLTNLFRESADLGELVQTVNRKTQRMLDAGQISLDTLDTNSDDCAPLVLELVDDLVLSMNINRLSGIYIVFNTQDLSGASLNTPIPEKTGIYLRDLDPTSEPSERGADLLLERAPIRAVQSMEITMDSAWQPRFRFPQDAPEERNFFLKPLLAAYAARRIDDVFDCGYWGPAMQVSYEPAITFSIPLILEDGTIYGVLGIDILERYLLTQIPSEELFAKDHGSYFIAVGSKEAKELETITPIVCGGTPFVEGQELTLRPSGSGYRFRLNGTEYYATAVSLSLYSRNAPYEGDKWSLMGVVAVGALYAFSNRVVMMLLVDLLLMLIFGILGSLYISRRISRPIRILSQEVEAAQDQTEDIPHLSSTGIQEIDRFSRAITDLSRDVLNASARFLQILRLASVELGGFEIRESNASVFVTDNLLPMLGFASVPLKELTLEQFKTMLEDLKASLLDQEADGSELYHVTHDGVERYIRVKVTELADGQVGIAEDVTVSYLDRLRVEHERDYDLLTGLLNRRAFYDRAGTLFAAPERLGYAALMMLDLDHLKYINDHYGHDCGDQYIRQATQYFSRNVPENTLCSRVSGDEFFLLFYGYPTPEARDEALDRFSKTLKNNEFSIPNGETMLISASGGIARYPGDSTEFRMLMKYADFAMYQIKHSPERKGSVGDFDLGVYNQESFLLTAKEEFFRLLNEGLVTFVFQPIVDARSGEVFAYEALMRTDLPTLHSPEMVLRIARSEGRLQDVEDLTWLKAPEVFRNLIEAGKVRPGTLLFINSLSSSFLSERAEARVRAEFSDLLDNVVVEIVGANELTLEALQRKQRFLGTTVVFAMDDYGKDRNYEQALHTLSPRFVKVDVSMIRDIDKDTQKQRAVRQLVEYARAHEMHVIAEGVESTHELYKVLELGVDLLQGYLLGRPSAVPPVIPQRVVDIIHECRVRLDLAGTDR